MAYYYMQIRFSQTDSENVLVDAINKVEALHVVSNYYHSGYTIDDVVKIDKIVKSL